MAEALVQAAGDHWTPLHELTALVAQEVRLVFRQMVVNGGGEDPGPVEIRRPGDPPAEKKKAGLREQMRRAMGR